MAEKFGASRWVKDGYLDNRTEGFVVGCLTFAAVGSVEFCLKGNFKEDITGQILFLKNSQFSDDPFAAHQLLDFANPQLGTVSLISLDPHPLLDPHPYIEWFSIREEHYRIELAPSDAWILDDNQAKTFDSRSQNLMDTLASRLDGAPSETRDSDRERLNPHD